MATKFYVYFDNTGQKIGIPIEENVMAVYADLVKESQPEAAAQAANEPEAYDTFEDLLIDHAAIAKPNNLQLRRLQLQVPGWGTAALPVLSNLPVAGTGAHAGLAKKGSFDATIEFHSMGAAEEAPYPVEAASEGDLAVQILGFAGESRLAN